LPYLMRKITDHTMKSFRNCNVALALVAFFLLNDPSWAQDETTFKKHTAPVKAVAFSPDGKFLATGGDDKMIFLWEVVTSELAGIIKTGFAVKAICFTDKDHFLAACGDDILLMDLNGKIIRTFSGYTTDIWSISYNAAAGKVTAGSYARTIRIWDFNTAKSLLLLEGHERSCLPVKFNPEGTIIASGSLDESVRLWDASTGKQLSRHDIHSENIFAIDFHPSGRYFASASADKTIRLCNAQSGKIIRTFVGHEGAVFDVKFSADGHHILSCDAKNTIILWETATGKRIGSYTVHKGAVNSVCFSRDGNGFASASDDNTAIYWKMDKKIFLAGSYYEQEIEKIVSESALFEPRGSNESKQDYSEREAKAGRYLDSLYGANYLKYIETLEKMAVE